MHFHKSFGKTGMLWKVCSEYKYIIETETYSEPSGTSKMKLFAKIVDNFQPLTILEKTSIVDVWPGSKYASDQDGFSFLVL